MRTRCPFSKGGNLIFVHPVRLVPISKIQAVSPDASMDNG